MKSKLAQFPRRWLKPIVGPFWGARVSLLSSSASHWDIFISTYIWHNLPTTNSMAVIFMVYRQKNYFFFFNWAITDMAKSTIRLKKLSIFVSHSVVMSSVFHRLNCNEIIVDNLSPSHSRRLGGRKMRFVMRRSHFFGGPLYPGAVVTNIFLSFLINTSRSLWAKTKLRILYNHVFPLSPH